MYARKDGRGDSPARQALRQANQVHPPGLGQPNPVHLGTSQDQFLVLSTQELNVPLLDPVVQHSRVPYANQTVEAYASSSVSYQTPWASRERP